jgi:hypothetical protein
MPVKRDSRETTGFKTNTSIYKVYQETRTKAGHSIPPSRVKRNVVLRKVPQKYLITLKKALKERLYKILLIFNLMISE